MTPRLDPVNLYEYYKSIGAYKNPAAVCYWCVGVNATKYECTCKDDCGAGNCPLSVTEFDMPAVPRFK